MCGVFGRGGTAGAGPAPVTREAVCGVNPYLPRDIPDPEHWAERAACNQPNVDPELWFGDGEASRRAAWICNHCCPVKVECLTDALSRPIAADHDGVWGGLTGDQRQQLRKRGAA